MADPLAEISDFEEWLGEEIPTDQRKRANRYLTMASNLVRGYAGADRVEAGGERADEAVEVVLAVAGRAWANPEATTQQSDTTGSDTASRSWGPRGIENFYLTSAEKMILGQGTSTPGLWVQPTSRGTITAEAELVEVEGGSPLPFPPNREPI